MSTPACPVPDCPGRVYPVTDRIIACDGPEPHGNEAIRQYAEALLDSLGVDPDADELDRRLDPHGWRRRMIDRASSTACEDVAEPSPHACQQSPPSWPTGLGGVSPTLAAYRGVTVLSGRASAGKTLSAVPSALSAAIGGWRVMYIAAEAPAVVYQRGMSWCVANGLDGWPDGFALRELPGTLTFDRLTESVKRFATTPRTLVVVDSINSLVDGLDGEDMFGLGHIKRLAMWMMRVRQFTRGEVSFLVVSEANASGETKGRSFDHKADLSVNFVKNNDDPNLKEVRVVKNWWGLTGMVGVYRYDVSRACLWPDCDVNGEDEKPDDDPFGQGAWH